MSEVPLTDGSLNTEPSGVGRMPVDDESLYADSGPIFEENRFKYFVSLGHRYPELIALHRQSGQLERSEAFNKPEQWGPVDEEGARKERPGRWGDPTEHCLVEAAAGEVLADMIGLSAEDKDTLIRTALVHDWRKRGEIEELRGVTDPSVVEVSYKKSKDDLLAAGVSQRIVSLTEAVAHTSLPDFAELTEDKQIVLKQNIPPLELAMHYIDDVTRGTDLVDLDSRMDYLDANSERYPYNEEGRAIWGGRTFFEAQRYIGHLVENELARPAGVADPVTLPMVIRSELVTRINSKGMTT